MSAISENAMASTTEPSIVFAGSDAHPDDREDVEVADEAVEAVEAKEANADLEPKDLEKANEPEVQETEAAQEEVAEVEEEAPRAHPMIPKSRLDEEISKRRAMEEKLKEFEAQKAIAVEDMSEEEASTFTETADTMFNAVLDGEMQSASEALEKIIKSAVSQTETRLRQEIQRAPAATRTQMELDTAAAEIQTKYSVFNNESEDFDQGLVDEVVTLRDVYISKGVSPADAVRKASKYVIADQRPDLMANDAPAQSVSDKAPAVKETNVKKNAKAAQSQVPNNLGSSNATGSEKTYDIDNMSDAEFDALPASVLARIRGDLG